MASATSFTFCGNPVPSTYVDRKSTSHRRYCCRLNVVCKTSTSEHPEGGYDNLSRRSLAVASGFAVLLGSLGTEEASAAKRTSTDEEKGLSAYDAKLLARYRRKEAMKEAMAKQKARSKPVNAKDAPVDVAVKSLPKVEQEVPTPPKVEQEVPNPPKVEQEVLTTPVPDTAAVTLASPSPAAAVKEIEPEPTSQ